MELACFAAPQGPSQSIAVRWRNIHDSTVTQSIGTDMTVLSRGGICRAQGYQ
jgi:hypothetical protein